LNPAIQSSPWVRQSSGAQAPNSTKIASIAVNAAGYSEVQPVGPNNTATAVVVESGNSQSYGIQMGPNGNYGGSFQGKVENLTPDSFVSPVRSDLYELRPGSGAGTYLGYFQLNPDGTMTFTAAGGSTVTPPAPTASIARSNAINLISFTTTNGASYQLRYTNEAGLTSPVTNWTQKAGVVIGNGLIQSINDDPSPDPVRFYVIEARP
jgi:hypothetical protein